MEDQKAENLLNLALSVPEETRERTEELNVGYDRVERTWEIIVKYHGNLESTLNEQFPGVSGTYLLSSFAILRVPERDVPGVIALPEIEYAEKPKRLFFALNQARAASCFLPVQTGTDGLTGKGVLVAVIDSGIDIFHEDFRNEDGTTRILYLDDQVTGKTYERQEINEICGERITPTEQAAVPWIPAATARRWRESRRETGERAAGCTAGRPVRVNLSSSALESRMRRDFPGPQNSCVGWTLRCEKRWNRGVPW